MHTKYFLLTVFCYWASLSSYLPSTTAHTIIKVPADEDNFDQNQEESLPKSLESLISVENGELSTEEMLHELLAGFSDNNFAAVSKKSDSEKKSTKPAAAGSKGKKKGKGNKKKPQPVVIEESEDTEDEDDEEEESDEKEDTIVVGKPEDKTEETPEPENPVVDNDGEIMQVGARIGEEFHHYEIQTCTMVEVPLHENGIELTLNPISNTKKIMLTINQLARCSQILESACPAGSRFCHVQDLSEDSTLKVGEEACHHNVAYLYLVPEKAAEPLEFELKVSITNEVQCKFAEQQQQGTSVNVDQYCQGLNAEQCQESAVDACTSKCMWVSCKVNNQDQQSLSSAYCAPANTSRDSLQQTCAKTGDFASAAPENQVIEYPVCAATNTDESVQQSESGFHVDILKILSITFAVSLALCLVFSCYYRYQFRHNKRELCSPPEWCPNCLFPRNSNQMERFMTSGNRNLDQEMSSDYQPPVL